MVSASIESPCPSIGEDTIERVFSLHVFLYLPLSFFEILIHLDLHRYDDTIDIENEVITTITIISSRCLISVGVRYFRITGSQCEYITLEDISRESLSPITDFFSSIEVLIFLVFFDEFLYRESHIGCIRLFRHILSAFPFCQNKKSPTKVGDFCDYYTPVLNIRNVPSTALSLSVSFSLRNVASAPLINVLPESSENRLVSSIASLTETDDGIVSPLQ